MRLNYIVNQIVPISRAANIYSQVVSHNMHTWHARMAFIGYMSWYINPKGFYWCIIYFYLRKP